MAKNVAKVSRRRQPARVQPDQERPASTHRAAPVAIRLPEPKTMNQACMIAAMVADNMKLIFADGPAGVGKTYLAAATAAYMYDQRLVRRIVLTRPAVEAGEELGFMPGELHEKYAPWMAPFRIELEKVLGSGRVELMVKNKDLVGLPLAHMRGHTFDNDFVILDEAQNTTPAQMKMFLTRIGENCKIVVDGDVEQKDIPGRSGLEDALSRLVGLDEVALISFCELDVVRSGLVQKILARYRI